MGGMRQSATSQQQREESYRQWLERKRTQKERQRADEIMRQYQHKEQLERDRNKRERDKEEKLADWIRRKEEEMKGNVLKRLLHVPSMTHNRIA